MDRRVMGEGKRISEKSNMGMEASKKKRARKNIGPSLYPRSAQLSFSFKASGYTASRVFKSINKPGPKNEEGKDAIVDPLDVARANAAARAKHAIRKRAKHAEKAAQRKERLRTSEKGRRQRR